MLSSVGVNLRRTSDISRLCCAFKDLDCFSLTFTFKPFTIQEIGRCQQRKHVFDDNDVTHAIVLLLYTCISIVYVV